MREIREISIVQLLGLVEAHQDVAKAAKEIKRLIDGGVDPVFAVDALYDAVVRLEQKGEA